MINLFQYDDETKAQAHSAIKQLERDVIKQIDAHRYGVILVDAEGNTIAINQQWQRLYLLPFQEVKDYNMLEDKNLQRKHIWSAIQGAFNGTDGVIEENYFSPVEWGKQGRSRWTEGHCLPIFGKEGKREHLLGTALILNDVTELKQSVLEVERLRQMVTEMNSRQISVLSRLNMQTPAKQLSAKARPKTMPEAQSILERARSIPRREREIFELLASGYSVKEVADHLDLAAKSVYTYRARLMQRLGIGSSVELAIAWRELHEPSEV